MLRGCGCEAVCGGDTLCLCLPAPLCPCSTCFSLLLAGGGGGGGLLEGDLLLEVGGDPVASFRGVELACNAAAASAEPDIVSVLVRDSVQPQNVGLPQTQQCDADTAA